MKTEYRELKRQEVIVALSLYFSDTSQDKKLIQDFFINDTGDIIVKISDNDFGIKRLTKE